MRGSERVRASFLLSVLGALAGTYSSCSTPFSSCEERRTCTDSTPDDGGGGQGGETPGVGGSSTQGGANSGEAGAPGDAGTPGDAGATGAGGSAGDGGGSGDGGAAGNGGEGGAPECLTDADCANDSFCDGVEQCVSGSCEPGSPACPNPDELHCNIACAEGADSAECTVTAKDLDGDDHGTQACAAAPGNDCNDSDDTIYTGAPELCDRLDNDCDNTPDLEDGLVVSGGFGHTFVIFGGADESVSAPAAAFAPVPKRFGVVWHQKNTNSQTNTTRFGAFAFRGTSPVFLRTLDTVNTTATSSGLVDIAWGDTTFGAIWTIEALTATRVNFRQVDAVGGMFTLLQPKSAGTTFSTFPRVARAGSNWIVSWFLGTTDTDRTLRARTITDAEAMTAGLDLLGGTFRLRNGLAANSQVVMAKTDVQGGAAIYEVRTPTLGDIANTGGTLNGEQGVIAGSNAGFGIAHQSGFLAFNPDGTTRCGPVPYTTSVQVFWDIIATARGYLFLGSSFGTPTLFEIGNDCTIGKPMPLSDVSIGNGASLAGDDATGYSIFWTEASNKAISHRMFGPNFCD